MVQGLGARHKGRSPLYHLHGACMPEKDGAEWELGRNGIIIITSSSSLEDSTRKTTWRATCYTVKASRSPQGARKVILLGGPGLIVSVLSLHSLPLLASSSHFYMSGTFAKGSQQVGVPLHCHRMVTASKATIHMGRKGNPQRPARKMTYVSPRKEDPELE